MLKIILFAQFSFFVSVCGAGELVNKNTKTVFSGIESNNVVTDRSNYQCGKINKKVIQHVLSTGVEVTGRDIHDYYSTSGCTVEGKLKVNNVSKKFSFDYGGYIYIGNDMIIACGKECCKNDFEYCTWEPDGLK